MSDQTDSERLASVFGDDESFYALLGKAICAWQGVEIGLLLIFIAATRPKNHDAAVSAFDTLMTAHPKRQATNAAVLKVVEPTSREVWTDLNLRVEKAATLRNRLAHDLRVRYFDGVSGQVGLQLMSKKQKEPLHKPDLERSISEFDDLMSDLIAFSAALTEGDL